MGKTHLFLALNNLFACVNIERINNPGRNKKRRCFRDEKEHMGPGEIQPFTCLPRFRVLWKLRPNPQEAIRSDYK